MGIISVKCNPITPTTWVNVNKSNCLDGAPALILQSELSCKNGGTITIIPPKLELDAAGNPPANDAPENTPPETVVQDGINNILSEAFDKVSQAESTSEMNAPVTMSENLQKSVNSALMLATALPPPSKATSIGKDNLSDLFPTYDIDETMIEQTPLSDLSTTSPQPIGSGVFSTYHVMKLLKPNEEIHIDQITNQLEPYSVLNNKIGEIHTGIAHNFHEQGYPTSVYSDVNDITKNAQNADASILLYATTKHVDYVTFKPHGELSEDSSEQKFAFYTQTQLQNNDLKTMTEFNQSFETDTILGAVSIAINQKK